MPDGARPCGTVALLASLAVTSTACDTTVAAPRPSYDVATRRLVRLDLPRADGRGVQARTYLDGARVFRTEVDLDGSGRVDRWEYFDPRGRLVKVGTSSAGDGVEDTWTYAADDEGVRRVEIATARDRRPDRRETYRADRLVAVEEDVNGDGRPDKWEEYADGVLRVVGFDPSYRAGRPLRRVVYDRDGRFSHVEVDPDGDGQFERLNEDGALSGKRREP